MATSPTTSGAASGSSGTTSTTTGTSTTTTRAAADAARDPVTLQEGAARDAPAAPVERVYTTPVPAPEDHPAERARAEADARHDRRVARLDSLVATLEGRMPADNLATLKTAVDAVRGRGADAADALDKISWLAAPDLMADDLAVLNATVTELKAEPVPA